VSNGVARLGSRFAIIGGAQRIEYDLRNDLYTSLQSLPPTRFAAYPTGDLMTRATSDVSAVKSLVGFGAVSTAGTSFAFVGALAAMLAVDPWLTLWAIAPYPFLIVVATRFNVTLHERTEAQQEQLGALSAVVQERLSGWPSSAPTRWRPARAPSSSGPTPSTCGAAWRWRGRSRSSRR